MNLYSTQLNLYTQLLKSCFHLVDLHKDEQHFYKLTREELLYILESINLKAMKGEVSYQFGRGNALCFTYNDENILPTTIFLHDFTLRKSLEDAFNIKFGTMPLTLLPARPNYVKKAVVEEFSSRAKASPMRHITLGEDGMQVTLSASTEQEFRACIRFISQLATHFTTINTPFEWSSINKMPSKGHTHGLFIWNLDSCQLQMIVSGINNTDGYPYVLYFNLSKPLAQRMSQIYDSYDGATSLDFINAFRGMTRKSRIAEVLMEV